MIIIKKPVITEKMTAISEKLNRFAFIVDKNANKYQIKDAIEKLRSEEHTSELQSPQ